MSIVFKHILRNIKENKFRSILIIFSLAVSTMVLFLNLTIKDDLFSMYKGVLQGAYQDFDIQISKKSSQEGDTYFDKDSINTENIKIDNLINLIYASGVFVNNSENIDVTFVGCDKKKMEDGNLCQIVERSDNYEKKDKNQIIISKKTADKYNLKINDNVKINTIKGEITYNIAALAATKGYFLMENDSFLIMSDIAYIQDLNGVNNNMINSVIINIKTEQSTKEAVKKMSKSNEKFDIYSLVDEEAVGEALNQINQLLVIIMVAVIILNFYVIRNIIKLIMSTRMPVVGTFRSIGATKTRMNWILILENIMYGIAGALFGIIFGMLLRKPVSSIFMNAGDAFDYVSINYKIKIEYFIFAIGFSICLQLIIAISSIIKAGKKSIKDNIFNTLSTNMKIKKYKIVMGTLLIGGSIILYFINNNYNMLYGGLGIIFAITGTVLILPILVFIMSKILTYVNKHIFGAAAELGTKTIYKSKITYSSIVLVTVSVSIMMVIYMTIMAISTIFTNAENNCQGDVLISGLEKEAKDYNNIENISGVIEVGYEYYIYDRIKFDDNVDLKETIIYGSDSFGTMVKGDKTLLENLSDDEILVDEYYANQNNIKKGSYIFISLENLQINNRKYKVKGFIDSSNFTTRRNFMFVNLHEFMNTYTKIPASMYLFTDNNPEVLKDTLKVQLAGENVYIQTKNEFIDFQRQQTNSILGMVEAMLGMSVLLSLFGLINNQIIGFIQKKKEYAVLYSTSMSKKQLKIMVLFEVFGTFASGCTIGTLLSLWLCKLLQQVLFAMGICVDITIRYKELGIAILAVFLVLSLTAVSPMKKISKIKIIDELKYE